MGARMGYLERMPSFPRTVFGATIVAMLGFAACGSDDEQGAGGTSGSAGQPTGGSSGSAGQQTGGSAGQQTGGTAGCGQPGLPACEPTGSLPLADCDPGTTPCANGATCTETGTAGLGVCPILPTYYDTPNCEPGPHPNGGEITPDCCTNADCTESGAGKCVYTESMTGCCGTQGRTYCVYDACQVDADCAEAEICLPAGTRGLDANRCVPAPCRKDADCTDGEEGECRLLGRETFLALICAYASDPCREDADCTKGPCGSDWCSPRWIAEPTSWVLDEGVECKLDESCLPMP